MGDHGIFFSAERRVVVFAAIEIAHAVNFRLRRGQRAAVVIERMSGVVLHWTLESQQDLDCRSAFGAWQGIRILFWDSEDILDLEDVERAIVEGLKDW